MADKAVSGDQPEQAAHRESTVHRAPRNTAEEAEEIDPISGSGG